MYENETWNKLFVVQNDSPCSWICPYSLCYGLTVWLWTWISLGTSYLIILNLRILGLNTFISISSISDSRTFFFSYFLSFNSLYRKIRQFFLCFPSFFCSDCSDVSASAPAFTFYCGLFTFIRLFQYPTVKHSIFLIFLPFILCTEKSASFFSVFLHISVRTLDVSDSAPTFTFYCGLFTFIRLFQYPTVEHSFSYFYP